MDGELFEIERSKLELDPDRDGGKPSVRGVTHGVFFFGVGEDALNRLGAKRVGRFSYRRMPDVLGLFKVVLPNVPGDSFGALLVLRAL